MNIPKECTTCTNRGLCAVNNPDICETNKRHEHLLRIKERRRKEYISKVKERLGK